MNRLLLALIFLCPMLARADSPDLEVVNRIKQEAQDNSQVMEHLFQLVEVYGPRITNSKGFMDSAKWATKRFEEWGLENAALEEWGPFGQGWSREYFSAHLTAPQYEQMIGYSAGLESIHKRQAGRPTDSGSAQTGKPPRKRCAGCR